MMADRYETVRQAIKDATNAASTAGWQGYESQAHIFLAALAAATGSEPPVLPIAAAEPETAVVHQVPPAFDLPETEGNDE
jgi:hypothetical protein